MPKKTKPSLTVTYDVETEYGGEWTIDLVGVDLAKAEVEAALFRDSGLSTRIVKVTTKREVVAAGHQEPDMCRLCGLHVAVQGGWCEDCLAEG